MKATALTSALARHCNGPMRHILKACLSHFMTIGLALASSSALGQSFASPDPIPVNPPKDLSPEPLIRLGSGEYFSSHALLMDKATRTLSVWKFLEGKVSMVMSVAADFGRNDGAKESAGDHKTPEGIYFFQELREGPSLNFDEYGVRAFTLDYPNFFDGLSRKSGSGIWLHAIPDSKSLLRGSRGCVVVRNDVIKNLSPYITLKRTPIVIQDAVTYLKEPEAESLRNNWSSWIEKWRTSWQSKNVDDYIKFYGADFKALGMDREKWRKYKQDLAGKYEFIKVNLTEPVVLHHGDEMVVRFLQDYSSDKNSDFGEKTLYLKKSEQGEFQIIGEEWRATHRSDIVANH